MAGIAPERCFTGVLPVILDVWRYVVVGEGRVKTAIALKRLTTLCGADLLPLPGLPDATPDVG